MSKSIRHEFKLDPLKTDMTKVAEKLSEKFGKKVAVTTGENVLIVSDDATGIQLEVDADVVASVLAGAEPFVPQKTPMEQLAESALAAKSLKELQAAIVTFAQSSGQSNNSYVAER